MYVRIFYGLMIALTVLLFQDPEAYASTEILRNLSVRDAVLALAAAALVQPWVVRHMDE